MFAESLLETSWAERGRRSWTTLTSFGLQAVIIGLLLMIPILSTVGLPLARVVSTPISMGKRDPGPPPRCRALAEEARCRLFRLPAASWNRDEYPLESIAMTPSGSRWDRSVILRFQSVPQSALLV
jgi:hypothetical protein